MFIKNTMKFLFVATMFSSANALANEVALSKQLQQITTSVERLCKAPTNKKSTYYKIVSKGKLGLKVKIFGLGGDATFKQEEWNGIQRVLQRDQANDNNSYRLCSIKLSPIFFEKFTTQKKSKIENKQQTKLSDSGNKITFSGNHNTIGKVHIGNSNTTINAPINAKNINF